MKPQSGLRVLNTPTDSRLSATLQYNAPVRPQGFLLTPRKVIQHSQPRKRLGSSPISLLSGRKFNITYKSPAQSPRYGQGVNLITPSGSPALSPGPKNFKSKGQGVNLFHSFRQYSIICPNMATEFPNHSARQSALVETTEFSSSIFAPVQAAEFPIHSVRYCRSSSSTMPQFGRGLTYTAHRLSSVLFSPGIGQGVNLALLQVEGVTFAYKSSVF